MRLPLINQPRPRQLQPRHDILPLFQSLEFGIRHGLLNLLRRDLSAGNLANGSDRVRSRDSNALRRACDGNVKQAGVRVRRVGRADARAGTRGFSLRKQREAGRPLDARLAAEQGSEDLELGLVGAGPGGEGRGAFKGEDHGVAAVVRDAFLAAVVLGRRAVDGGEAFRRGRGAVGEELLDPVAEVFVRGAVGDDGNVGLGVGGAGKGLEAVGGEVSGQGRGRGRVQGCTEATVEGEAVGGVEGEGLGRGEEGFLRVFDGGEDFFVEFVACSNVGVVSQIVRGLLESMVANISTRLRGFAACTYACTWYSRRLRPEAL